METDAEQVLVALRLVNDILEARKALSGELIQPVSEQVPRLLHIPQAEK